MSRGEGAGGVQVGLLVHTPGRGQTAHWVTGTLAAMESGLRESWHIPGGRPWDGGRDACWGHRP